MPRLPCCGSSPKRTRSFAASNAPCRRFTGNRCRSIAAVSVGGLGCTAISLGGSYPDYVSAALRNNLAQDEAVIGLEFAHNGKKFFFAPSISGQTEAWKCRANAAALALLDGTFWTDNELIDVRGGGKTAREIGHIPLSGPEGLLAQLGKSSRERNRRRVLIHLNNTNPVLDESSDASRTVRDAGWEVAYDGMKFQL